MYQYNFDNVNYIDKNAPDSHWPGLDNAQGKSKLNSDICLGFLMQRRAYRG